MYAVRDIVITGRGFRREAYAICEITNRPSTPYTGIRLDNGRKYRIHTESIVAKIGVCEASFLNAPTVEDSFSVSSDEVGSLDDIFGNDEDRKRREILNSLKSGDPVKIRIRGKIDTAIFLSRVPRATKYVFSATNSRGTTYRYPLSAIVV